MGLLSWRRSARGSDSAPKDPVSPQGSLDSPGRPEHEVIRAGTYATVPDWARLPPIAPVLPEMPWVVARHFEDSLTSWQPPERFLRPLGHSVSPAAPSGLVEGIMVSSPGLAAGPPDEAESAAPAPGINPATASISDDQFLTLANPPASSSDGAGQRQVLSSRSIPGPWDPGPTSSAGPESVSGPRHRPDRQSSGKPPPAPPRPQSRPASRRAAPDEVAETGGPLLDAARPGPDPGPPGPEDASQRSGPPAGGDEGASTPEVVDLVGSTPLGAASCPACPGAPAAGRAAPADSCGDAARPAARPPAKLTSSRRRAIPDPPARRGGPIPASRVRGRGAGIRSGAGSSQPGRTTRGASGAGPGRRLAAGAPGAGGPAAPGFGAGHEAVRR